MTDKILVKEGDRVEAGQVLIGMNGTQARSQAEVVRAQLLSARAVEARLDRRGATTSRRSTSVKVLDAAMRSSPRSGYRGGAAAIVRDAQPCFAKANWTLSTRASLACNHSWPGCATRA
ncbi:hypothetical protein ACU4GD_14865 [Cupriavidus basilensis]